MFIQMFCYFGSLDAASQIDDSRTSGVFSTKHTSKIAQLVFGINHGISKIRSFERCLQNL